MDGVGSATGLISVASKLQGWSWWPGTWPGDSRAWGLLALGCADQTGGLCFHRCASAGPSLPLRNGCSLSPATGFQDEMLTM